MVSFILDTIKFLLIFRHLQNIYWFKRENLYLSPILPLEAFALPELEE